MEDGDWRNVDHRLQVIAKQRAGLDVVEARWLRKALELEIWKPLGMVSMLDYMDRVLGYAPHNARERLRLAEALSGLPLLEQALARGELTYSGARELSRVVVPNTEAEWLAAIRGKSQREIEVLVADHPRGSRPSDPGDPEVREQTLRIRLSADVYARLRQARVALDEEHGRHLDDGEVIAALVESYFDATASTSDGASRARNSIALTVCDRCQQGWQEGGGRKIPVDAATVERARCDARHLGSIHANVPARAYQDVSPAVRRTVFHRDGGCCRVPGCRSARGIEIHHLVHRADGGTHEPSNLILACGACHRALHERRLILGGTADEVVVHYPNHTSVDAVEHEELASEIDTLVRAISNNVPLEPDRNVEPTHDTPGSSHVGHRNSSDVHDNGILRIDAANDRVFEEGPPVVNPGSHGRCVDASANQLHAFRPDDAPRTLERNVLEPAFASSVSDVSHVGRRDSSSRFERAIIRSQAKDALAGLGWHRGLAGAAVDAVLAEAPEAPLVRVIGSALQRCLQARRST